MSIKSVSRKKIIAGLVLAAGWLVFMAAGLYNKLTVTEYTIRTSKVTSEIKIVLLADLHNCSYGEGQVQLIETIEQQEPDLILMPGDIMDDVLPDEKTADLLEGIAGRYPCYYVTGNHEFWSERVEEQKELMRSYGVTVLEGESDTISLNGQTLFIYGIDDPSVGRRRFTQQFDAAADSARESQYNILLAHRPELFSDYIEHDFDLVVSGHAHGGQWRLPFLLPNGLFAPNQGLFPRYTRGVHTQNGTSMVVSRGLSRETTRIPRFFNRPEVVVIHLVPGVVEAE